MSVTVNDNELELLLNCIDFSIALNPTNKEEGRESLERIRERTKRAIERRDEKRAFEEEIKKTATKYVELEEGDLFRITVSKSDLRVYRRDKEGSTLLVDSFGSGCEFKLYRLCSLDMTVYKIERR